VRNLLARFSKDRSGATSIEYAFIAALISMGVITGATSVGAEVSAIFDDAATGLAAR